MTNKQLKDLIERLNKHKQDYDEGRVQFYGAVCGDCFAAAEAIETLMLRGERVTEDFERADAPDRLMTRKYILDRAAECVCGHRQDDYGSPEDNFATIAQLWTAYSGYPFEAVDVAMMMALLKIARIGSGRGTEDSFVDLAGYAACGGEIAAKQQSKEGELEWMRDLPRYSDEQWNDIKRRFMRKVISDFVEEG